MVKAKPLPPARNWSLWIAVALALVISCIAGCVLYQLVRTTKEPPPSYMDEMLGCVERPEVAESGFYYQEQEGGEPYRWTDGHATLTVPLVDNHPPRALSVMLGLAVPRPTRVCIRVNGQSLWDKQMQRQQIWARSFPLDGLSLHQEVVIEIITDSFVPAREKKGDGDMRNLGVRVHGVTLHSAEQDYRNKPLGGRFVPGVEEDGFYGPEKEGGEPYRWSNGAARLVIPVRDKKPTALSLRIGIPGEGRRLTILANGQKLFDQNLEGNARWTATLPLKDIDVGEALTVELKSDTRVPAEVNPKSKDRRTLGVRVKEVTLLGAE